MTSRIHLRAARPAQRPLRLTSRGKTVAVVGASLMAFLLVWGAIALAVWLTGTQNVA